MSVSLSELDFDLPAARVQIAQRIWPRVNRHHCLWDHNWAAHIRARFETP
jgi:hypothetical protein